METILLQFSFVTDYPV